MVYIQLNFRFDSKEELRPTYLRRKAGTDPVPCCTSVVYEKALISRLQNNTYKRSFQFCFSFSFLFPLSLRLRLLLSARCCSLSISKIRHLIHRTSRNYKVTPFTESTGTLTVLGVSGTGSKGPVNGSSVMNGCWEA